MSDTAITDANVCITTKEGCETIAPDICRKFERENAAMRERIAALESSLDEKMKDLLENADPALRSAIAKVEIENAAMREAIKKTAHHVEAILSEAKLQWKADAPLPCIGTIEDHASAALYKLKPFLP